MKFFTVATLFIAGVLAAPSKPDILGLHSKLCPAGLESIPRCCATDVLGVADLDCQPPVGEVCDARTFKAACASGGQRARCCGVPILGQALLCHTPLGI
ncbi:hydrophobin precursor [Trichoderma arundinaceum]|uniref:Hydrophobin n=1 Tax=Trichoderma arundinaceum TaxID=490622 RepID=A0A395NKN9_TRIAR|nr:hydrophobin precursor [Trichoderma arundinaceum]